MKDNFFSLSISFFVLLIFQLLIFSNIQISGFANPYLYLIFIVVFPIRFNTVIHLCVSFLLGFIVDLFHFTYGIHALASVFAAYVRTPLLTLFFYRAKEELKEISINSLGVIKFSVFSLILIFFHHILLFQFEAFTFSGFFITTCKALASSFLTLIIFLIYQFITIQRK